MQLPGCEAAQSRHLYLLMGSTGVGAIVPNEYVLREKDAEAGWPGFGV